MASVADAVLDAAKAAVEAITWDPAPAATMTVKKRKSGEVTDPEMPAVVLWVGAGETGQKLTAVKKVHGYPLMVEIALGGPVKLGDTGPILAWRQQIDRTLSARAAFAGVAGWNRTEPQNLTPFDQAALSRGKSVSMQRFVVEILEPREG